MDNASQNAMVFLDRDGTINIEQGYVLSADSLMLIDGVAEAIARLKTAGFVVYVISNQSAIGRNLVSEAEVERANKRMQDLLLAENQAAVIDGIYYCPHHPEEKCDCRKPDTGMVAFLRNDPQFDPLSCWIVGDKQSDLDFGRNLGIPAEQCLLVLTGHGISELARMQAVSDAGTEMRLPLYAEDLQQAVSFILGEESLTEEN